MAIGVSGHNEENDDVFGTPVGGLIDPNSRLWNPAGTGSAYDNDVNRLRTEGAQGQEAVQVDQRQANYARDMQMGSLGHLQRQADGSAASSAAILGQRANQGAAQSMAAASLGKGGPGAGLARLGAVAPQAGNAALQANVQNAGARAGEIGRGQSAYGAGALSVQSQDIQAATANAQLQAQQRALNEARQQANEKLAWDTRNAQMHNANTFLTGQQTDELHRRQTSAAQEAEDWNKVIGYGSSTTGGIIGFAGAATKANDPKSDRRAKDNIVPMGSLSSLEYR